LIRGLLRGDILDEAGVNNCIERSYQFVHGNEDLMDPGGEEPSEEVLDARLDREEFDRYAYARSLEELELDSLGALGFVYKCLSSAILLLRLAMRKLSPRPDSLAAATLFEELTVD
jgi:hypothetical protein